MSFLSLLSVAAGGAIGASARFLLSTFMAGGSRFPWATMTVNVLGCLAAGFLVGGLLSRLQLSQHAQLFLTTGLLGGFTTFSAFSVDSLRLAETGQLALATTYILVNVLGSLLAVAVGWWLARLFVV